LQVSKIARCKTPRGASFLPHMRLVLWMSLVTGCAMGGGGAMKQATMGASPNRQPNQPIAIGARFHPDITTTVAGTTTPNLRLESAVPEIVAVDNGALVGKAPGTSAVLITTDDGSVVDFVHVWVAPITSISLATKDGERVGGSIGLAVGEDLTLVPALWSGAQRLAGEGEVAWTVADAGVVSVLRDGTADRRRLRARAPGKTTVTIALGTATTTLDLEVVP
jgi:hypothetical protein